MISESRLAVIFLAQFLALNFVLADDLTYTHTSGWIETKSEFMSTVESGRINYMAVTPSEVKVRIYGDIAADQNW